MVILIIRALTKKLHESSNYLDFVKYATAESKTVCFDFGLRCLAYNLMEHGLL